MGPFPQSGNEPWGLDYIKHSNSVSFSGSMAHIKRAMDLACITVCDLAKAGKGRKALCAALEIFRKVDPQDLSVDHKRTFVKFIASAVVALDKNMLNRKLNEGDIKSLVNLLHRKHALLLGSIPRWFGEVIKQQREELCCSHCAPGIIESMRLAYLKGFVFLLHKVLVKLVHVGGFICCCILLEGNLAELGISQAVEPLMQFFRILDEDYPADPRSQDAKDFRKGARDMLNFIGSGCLTKEFYQDTECKEYIDNAVDIGLMCAVCKASNKKGDEKKTWGKMPLCSRCQSRAYCSKECQNQDWKEHKQSCWAH
jgi:hypothetical protein